MKAKDRLRKDKPGIMRRAIRAKMDEKHIKKNIKAANKRVKKDGVDFNKA